MCPHLLYSKSLFRRRFTLLDQILSFSIHFIYIYWTTRTRIKPYSFIIVSKRPPVSFQLDDEGSSFTSWWRLLTLSLSSFILGIGLRYKQVFLNVPSSLTLQRDHRPDCGTRVPTHGMPCKRSSSVSTTVRLQES